jgi:GxxExxY protein
MGRNIPLMDTDKHGFLFREETHGIIGCAMEVINNLGNGFHEKIYENALCIEFTCQNISFRQQVGFDVYYKMTKAGEYIPDLIVNNRIIIDTKTIERITNIERGQLINYLKITNLKIGLIINFKHPKLEWERIVL